MPKSPEDRGYYKKLQPQIFANVQGSGGAGILACRRLRAARFLVAAMLLCESACLSRLANPPGLCDLPVSRGFMGGLLQAIIRRTRPNAPLPRCLHPSCRHL